VSSLSHRRDWSSCLGMIPEYSLGLRRSRSAAAFWSPVSKIFPVSLTTGPQSSNLLGCLPSRFLDFEDLVSDFFKLWRPGYFFPQSVPYILSATIPLSLPKRLSSHPFLPLRRTAFSQSPPPFPCFPRGIEDSDQFALL